MTAADGTVLRLAGSARDLAVFAERAARHDPATPVRLVGAAQVLAAFVTTPFDCLGLRVTRLCEAADLDVVVEAVGLGSRARGAGGGADAMLVLPPRLPDITWAQPLPPRAGWSEMARLTATEVAARVRADSDEYRLRSTQVEPGRAATSALTAIAEHLWSQPLLADVPARLAHAADYLGFVPDDGQVALRSAGPWRRLDTALGVTLVRVTDPLGLVIT